MKREWQVGEAALVTARLNRPERVMIRGRLKWYGHDGYLGDQNVADVRPVVVIDPEDREQVERLAAAWEAADYAKPGPVPMTMTEMRMLSALREFADPEPPKPDEPTGLGAVVEDASGGKWVRLVRSGEDSTRDDWKRSGYRGCDDDDTWHFWSDIDAVKVLSEGVTP